MTDWWDEKLCKMCDAGMCGAVDGYKAQGMSEREASRKASADTGEYFTANQILYRYRYHTGRHKKAVGNSHKMEIEKKANPDLEILKNGTQVTGRPKKATEPYDFTAAAEEISEFVAKLHTEAEELFRELKFGSGCLPLLSKHGLLNRKGDSPNGKLEKMVRANPKWASEQALKLESALTFLHSIISPSLFDLRDKLIS